MAKCDLGVLRKDECLVDHGWLVEIADLFCLTVACIRKRDHL